MEVSALQEFMKVHQNGSARKWTTLIVPVCDFGHWSLAVLSEMGFLKFDFGFADNTNFHGP